MFVPVAAASRTAGSARLPWHQAVPVAPIERTVSQYSSTNETAVAVALFDGVIVEEAAWMDPVTPPQRIRQMKVPGVALAECSPISVIFRLVPTCISEAP